MKAAASPSTRLDAETAVERATRRVAPLWPLSRFVAVNPFLGLTDRTLQEAASLLGAAAGARLTLPRREYARAIREGRIQDRHLAAALREVDVPGVPGHVQALKTLALAGVDPAPPEPVPTVADVAARATGLDVPELVIDRVSAWAAGYYDEGQASWTSPFRDLGPYAAWREEAAIDRTLDVAGLRGLRAAVDRLPLAPRDLRREALARLDVPADALDLYLHRLLMSVGGWAGYVRHRVWENELRGRRDGSLAELLSIRLAYEVALLEWGGLDEAWAEARQAIALKPSQELAIDLALHTAYEKAVSEPLLAAITAGQTEPTPDRPDVQAVFCIDVRSEVLRRALEAQGGVETLGFAGFFGIPAEVVPLGQERGGARCPVLLAPKAVVREGLRGATDEEEQRVAGARLLHRRVASAWRSFKRSAVSSFAFVSAVGLLHARRLLTDTMGIGRPVPAPRDDGLSPADAARLTVRLEPSLLAGRSVGIPAADRLDLAENVLRGMSLTSNLARLVALVGHGSSTVNNPHASGLDCGACGGHTGEASAQLAAAILGDPAVRAGLRERGIHVPADTVFVAALHDTTTDEVRLLGEVPPTHATDLERLREQLAAAGRAAREERARRLFTDGESLRTRGRDWSQVRPEWGLAGCAAFVAAPRFRTAGADLGGRAFLHSYTWGEDRDFAVLELVMTAPMVVASWIGLQYFGSTVDNRVFGSGNKVLHNVVGGIGVLEGNGGDLRVGLPWQSVHDGERLAHEPVRLDVVIEAPIEAMNGVLRKHPQVRELLENGWLRLHRMGEDGTLTHRYVRDLRWEEVSSPSAAHRAA